MLLVLVISLVLLYLSWKAIGLIPWPILIIIWVIAIAYLADHPDPF